MERSKLANQYHETGYSCAQSVACVFPEVTKLPIEQLAALCGAFGGGFRADELCGVVSGAAVVIGARWPHSRPEDLAAKDLAAEKMQDFHRRFLSRFPSLVCRDLKPQAPDFQASDPDLQGLKPCSVYIAAAVEILEEMLAGEAHEGERP